MEDNPTLLDSVDARTRLAGSNSMEILLFSLGTKEIFGINVFKVREVTRTPPITPCPNMPQGVEGVIALRGNIIPVLDLSTFLGVTGDDAGPNATMMVTEYSRRTQGFLVRGVDRIVRVDWDRVRAPDSVLAGHDGLITAITQLPDGTLVSILDVEQILANAFGEVPVPELAAVRSDREHTVFFVDDSLVARKEITAVLDKLAVRHHSANNGAEAWERLKGLASRAQAEGRTVDEVISVILVDAEMPEMDGYVLTRNLKADARFARIPILMHSSLSSEANRAMGKSVGVDAYVAKFDPGVLADTLRPLLK
jgi:two-component system chemotaxis response regulator CheV